MILILFHYFHSWDDEIIELSILTNASDSVGLKPKISEIQLHLHVSICINIQQDVCVIVKILILCRRKNKRIEKKLLCDKPKSGLS